MRTATLLVAATMTVACGGGDAPSRGGSSPSVTKPGPPPPPRLVGTPPDRVLPSVEFAGYLWDVTHRPRGAAPTTVGGFSGRHAWLDSRYRLNLRLERIGKAWQGGAVVSQKVGWGYGTYEWTIEGRIDGFHENAVVGLFTYEEGAPGNREIDIEIARFGRESGRRNASSTLHHRNGDSFYKEWAIGRQSRTIHSFTWRPGQVTWTTRDANKRIIHRARARTTIEPGGEQVHMNIWVCCERSPDRPQHVVISDFNFRPM